MDEVHRGSAFGAQSHQGEDAEEGGMRMGRGGERVGEDTPHPKIPNYIIEFFM